MGAFRPRPALLNRGVHGLDGKVERVGDLLREGGPPQPVAIAGDVGAEAASTPER